MGEWEQGGPGNVCNKDSEDLPFFPSSTRTCAQACPTLWGPVDCSPPASSVHEIHQARMLEWVAMSFSRRSFLTQGSNPHLLHWQADSLPLSRLGHRSDFCPSKFYQHLKSSHIPCDLVSWNLTSLLPLNMNRECLYFFKDWGKKNLQMISVSIFSAFIFILLKWKKKERNMLLWWIGKKARTWCAKSSLIFWSKPGQIFAIYTDYFYKVKHDLHIMERPELRVSHQGLFK